MISGLVDALFRRAGSCWPPARPARRTSIRCCGRWRGSRRRSIAFVESTARRCWSRISSSAGSLEYRGAGKLSRVVTEPYRERTDIDGGDVRIQRDGRARAPVLAAPQSRSSAACCRPFRPCSTGDRAALEQASNHRSRSCRTGGNWISCRDNAGPQERIEQDSRTGRRR